MQKATIPPVQGHIAKPVLLRHGQSVDNTTRETSNGITTKPVHRKEWTHEDHESDKLRVGTFSALARDNVPLLRRAHNHLCRHYLLLVQLMITGQLVHLNAVRAQTLINISNLCST